MIGELFLRHSAKLSPLYRMHFALLISIRLIHCQSLSKEFDSISVIDIWRYDWSFSTFFNSRAACEFQQFYIENSEHFDSILTLTLTFAWNQV